jgi:hypothetical protein
MLLQVSVVRRDSPGGSEVLQLFRVDEFGKDCFHHRAHRGHRENIKLQFFISVVSVLSVVNLQFLRVRHLAEDGSA